MRGFLWFLAVILIGDASRSRAADITWTNIGPGGGGWIEALACDPRDPETIYLGCDVGGFYISHDAGRSWRIRNTGLNNYFVECIAVHPADSNILLLGMEGGIFKSTDQGRTWSWKRKGFPAPEPYSYSAPIGALCFDPSRPGVLYAGIGRPRFEKDGKGQVYKSEDAGETWRLTTPEGVLDARAIVSDLEAAPDGSFVLADIQDFCADPKSFDTLYTCQREFYDRSVQPPALLPGGLYKSTDGGKRWSAIHTSRFASCMAVSPLDSRTLYVGTTDHPFHDESRAQGVFVSTDGGQTWRQEVDGLSCWNVSCICIDPHDPSRLYLGTAGNGAVCRDPEGSTLISAVR